MKFKFCSDGDCPLWALAALHALSSLPASLFRALLHQAVEEQPDDGIMEILKDTSLSSRSETARAAAAIRWVLQQTWRCSCSGTQLTRDLLVLGVPRAHATALAEAADEGREAYEAGVKAAFMVNKLTDASVAAGPPGTADVLSLTLHSEEFITGKPNTKTLLIDKTQAKSLLGELKKAYNKMEEIQE